MPKPSACVALAGEDAEAMEAFLAWATGVLGVMMETGALGMMWCGVRVDTLGRVGAGFAAVAVAVEAGDAREVRGVVPVPVPVRVREGTFSVLGRDVVEGRFAAAAAAAVVVEAGVRVVRLAVVAAGARVGGLLRREVELARGFDALLDGRVAVGAPVVVFVDADADAAADRRAVVAAPAAGRRGGTASFFVAVDACEAILRRTTDDGEDGAGSALCWYCGCGCGCGCGCCSEVLDDPSAAILGQLQLRLKGRGGAPARPRCYQSANGQWAMDSEQRTADSGQRTADSAAPGHSLHVASCRPLLHDVRVSPTHHQSCLLPATIHCQWLLETRLDAFSLPWTALHAVAPIPDRLFVAVEHIYRHGIR